MLKKLTAIALLSCAAIGSVHTTEDTWRPKLESMMDQIFDPADHPLLKSNPTWRLSHFIFLEEDKTPEKLRDILEQAAEKMTSEEFCNFLQDYLVFEVYRCEYGGLLFDIIERVSSSVLRLRLIVTVLEVARAKLTDDQLLSVLTQQYHTDDPASELNGLDICQFNSKKYPHHMFNSYLRTKIKHGMTQIREAQEHASDSLPETK